MKTRAEYQAEQKKAKLKVPKVEEFTISFNDGVSERLKVHLMFCLSHTHSHSRAGRYCIKFGRNIFFHVDQYFYIQLKLGDRTSDQKHL